MGLPEKESTVLNPSEIEKKLRHHIQKMIGTFEMTYPPYSAARVNGKPLYYWARKNKLAEIVLPTKQIHITEFNLLKSFTLHSSELMTAIRNRVLRVQGDFRQQTIIDAWAVRLHPDAIFPVYTMSIHCSSGAYVRAIAEYLGAQIGCGAIAYTIKRTQIGPYELKDAVRIL
jgi:tRNA pseudouridine(55) synthase